MRAYDWAEWRSRRRGAAGAAAAVAERRTLPPGHPPRTIEEREMILRGVVALMHRRDAEGRLVLVAPRTYELRPPRRRD